MTSMFLYNKILYKNSDEMHLTLIIGHNIKSIFDHLRDLLY
jgi:hypothetical protein